jgi:hypothetical protein
MNPLRRVLLLGLVALATGGVMSAHSALVPPVGSPGATNVQFRSIFDSAGGQRTDGDSFTQFSASAFDDETGARQGQVFVSFIDLRTFHQFFISCSGSEFADSISVVSGNGNATVTATLDLSNPRCFGNVLGPITLTVSGQANGTPSFSQVGIGTSQSGGNFFSVTFYGSVGSVVGPFDGGSQTIRRTNRQRVN